MAHILIRSLLSCISLAIALRAGAAPAPVDLANLETRPAAQALPTMIQQLLSALPADSLPWKRYLSDRAVYVSEAGDVATKSELLSAFRPFPPGLSGSIKVKNPAITEHGDVAIVVFDADETQTIFDQKIEVAYFGTHVWHRESGRWRLIAAQAAVRAKDPPPLPVDARRLDDYAGTYGLSDTWRYRVEARGDTLLGGSPGRELEALIPIGENVFADRGSSLGVLRMFVRGPDGKVARMVQRRKFAYLDWKRLP
jgi:hypothetical protein